MVNPNAKQHISENGQVEIVHNPSRAFGISLDPLLACGTEMEQIEDGSYSEDGSEYDEEPNIGPSLLEYENDDGDDDEDDSAYHPALKTAVIAEGQEAVWVEDEVSTVCSVLVRPQHNARKSALFRFRKNIPKITIPENDEYENEKEELQKVHVKKTKIKKTVILLPQRENEGVKTLVEANVKQEAAVNMVKARQLLRQALLIDVSVPRLQDSEQLAKVAFAHAATARRLMSHEDEPDLEDVLSFLAEKGEHAAFQHQNIVFSQSFTSESIIEPKRKQGGVIHAAGGYASKAMHFLESMLPLNIDKELQESLSDEIFPSDTMSTLGFKTDTFEYQMGPEPAAPTKSYTNMDLMSISSLNELLDGPLNDASNKPSSPRQDVPVINIPRHTRQGQTMTTPMAEIVPNVSEEALEVSLGEEEQEKDHPLSLTSDMEEEESLEAAESPVKQKKKRWSSLGKFQLGGKKMRKEKRKVEKQSLAKAFEEGDSIHSEGDLTADEQPSTISNDESCLSKPIEAEISLSRSNSDPPDQKLENTEIPSIEAGMSQSSEIESEQQSNNSRYHIEQTQSDEKSAAESAANQISDTSNEHVKKTKSDQHESLDWRKTCLGKVEISSSPTKSIQQTGSDWDKNLDLAKIVTTEKTMENRLAESTVNSLKKAAKNGQLDQMDMRSLQSNTADDVVDGTQTGESQTQTCSRADGLTVQATDASKKENIKGGASRVSSRSGATKKSIASREMPIFDESTEAGQDSLMGFVISPKRANIITPGGSRPFEAVRGDEPSNIIIPTLQPIVEQQFLDDATETVGDDETTEPSVTVTIVKPQKAPKMMNRISNMFGARNKTKSIPGVEERKSSDEKDVGKAIDDGNMHAFEANINAEDAPSSFCAINKNRKQKATEGPAHKAEEAASEAIIEQVLSNAIMKAEEANLEAEAAPKRHRRCRHHKNSHVTRSNRDSASDDSSRGSHSLVDAIRMQAGLERNGGGRHVKREAGGDAPGEARRGEPLIGTDKDEQPPRMDPPKAENVGYRVLAPTPRKKTIGDVFEEGKDDEESADIEKKNKYDQRRVTELLYGGSVTGEPPIVQLPGSKRVGAMKGVYIGDLIDGETTEAPIPARVDTDQSEEDEEQESHKAAEMEIHVGNENDENLPVSPNDNKNQQGKLNPEESQQGKTTKTKSRTSMLKGIRNMMMMST